MTGGFGFIGQYVVEELQRRGYTPLVLDRGLRPWSERPAVEVFLGDVRDAAGVTEAAAHADAIIHLAGVLGTQETISNPRPAAETNVLGGLNVFEAAVQYDLPLVNIAVGNHWMNNTYSITKSTMERFAEMYRVERGLRVAIVRALNAYGPRQSVARPYGSSKVRKIMPAFVMRALDGKSIEIYGDGSQIMDMIHVTDVARTLVSTLETLTATGRVEHVIEAGTGRSTTVKDIAETVLKAVGVVDTDAMITHLPMRPGEPEHSVVLGDSTTLNEVSVDPSSLVRLEDGVVDTIEYYRHYFEGFLACKGARR